MAVTIRSVLGSGGGGGEIPNGRTVTPVNNVGIWLNCGGIFDKSYTMVSEVLNDYKTLIILLGDSNAVDYLVRSTTWIQTICANEVAMIVIGSNDYCASTLLNNFQWNLGIINSDYMNKVFNVFVPIMTSATEPSGQVIASSEWSASYASWMVFDNNHGSYWATASGQVTDQYIGYEFENTVKIYAVQITNYSNITRIPKNCKVQYLDGNEWVDNSRSEFVNPDTSDLLSKYPISPDKSSNSWRLFISDNYGATGEIDVRTLQFYGRL